MKNMFVDNLMKGFGFNNFSELSAPKREELLTERYGLPRDVDFNKVSLEEQKAYYFELQNAKKQIDDVFKFLIKLQEKTCELVEYKQRGE